MGFQSFHLRVVSTARFESAYITYYGAEDFLS